MLRKTVLMLMLCGLAGIATLSLAVAAEPAADKPPATAGKRILLALPYEDREAMKREMRNNLDQVRRLLAALVANDFAAIEQVAKEISLHKKRSQVVVRRGNAEFTAMAVNFHAVLAPEIGKAAQAKDAKRVAQAVDVALNACVACHETFTLTEWPDNKSYTRPEPPSIFRQAQRLSSSWRIQNETRDGLQFYGTPAAAVCLISHCQKMRQGTQAITKKKGVTI